MPYGQQKSTLTDASCSGPRGIRTPGLLNAIETRSQLRYGPGNYLYSLPSALPIPRGGDCVRYGPGNHLYFLPLALPIPRGGDCVRYGPGNYLYSLPSALPIPRGGGCVRYGPGNYLYSLPSALPIPRGGGCVRYGPGINFIKITRSAPAVCPSGASRLLMDLEGFEPSASSVRLKRAPNCATGPLTKPGTSFHEKTTRFQSSKILTDSNRDVKLQIISILAWPK